MCAFTTVIDLKTGLTASWPRPERFTDQASECNDQDTGVLSPQPLKMAIYRGLFSRTHEADSLERETTAGRSLKLKAEIESASTMRKFLLRSSDHGLSPQY